MIVRATILCLLAMTGTTNSVAQNPSSVNATHPRNSKHEWRYYNGDLGGTKYSDLEQINTGNVQDLELVWQFRVPDFVEGKNTTLQFNPLMVNGVLYLATVGQKIIAVKPNTAEPIWTLDPYQDSGAREAEV